MNSPSAPAAPRLLPLGDTAWTVEFGQTIAPALHARVQGLAEALARARADEQFSAQFAAIVDVVPTFRSLTVHYDPLQTDGERLGEHIMGAGIAAFQQEMDKAQADWQFVNYAGAVHCFAEANAASPPGCVYHPLAAKRAFAAMHGFFDEVFSANK